MDIETQEYRTKMLPARQALPLDLKIGLTKNRIRSWYEYYNGQVYISFSGGKDSTVLLDLVRQDFPDVPAVFVDTGLEYPEIRDFVKSIPNVFWIKPKMGFKDVLEKYGYPVIGKETSQFIYQCKHHKSEKTKQLRLYGAFGRKGQRLGNIPFKWQFLLNAPFECSDRCCDIMKKLPMKEFQKKSGRNPMVGTMADESRRRRSTYYRNGCNAFNSKMPLSTPMSFWLEADVWDYIKTTNLPYCKIYDMGYHRTGCMFCMFGVQHEKQPNRFQRMAETHPAQYKYCIEKLGLGVILDFIKVPYRPETYPLFDFCNKLTNTTGNNQL